MIEIYILRASTLILVIIAALTVRSARAERWQHTESMYWARKSANNAVNALMKTRARSVNPMVVYADYQHVVNLIGEQSPAAVRIELTVHGGGSSVTFTPE